MVLVYYVIYVHFVNNVHSSFYIVGQVVNLLSVCHLLG
jgi:hypothetical protein